MKKYYILIIIAICFLPQLTFAVDLDSDFDGLSDAEEARYYTDPNNPDTDGDGFLDGMEVAGDYSPHLGNAKRMNEFDFDNDGLNDWVERWFGSDMGKADTDGDGTTDFAAVMEGFSPLNKNFTTSTLLTTTTFARKIEVDRTNQRLYYFVDGIKILNMPVSTGNPITPTPKGDFSIIRKVPVVWYKGENYSYPNTKWNLEFKRGYYIHTAYWHNNFGIRTMSHGCVNMRLEDAELLYKYIDVGVPVNVIGETPKRLYVQV